MNRADIAELVSEFLSSYDALAKDRIWQQHSVKFRRFWSERVRAPAANPLVDEECDSIIRILDIKGKGNTKADEAVANTMVPQGAWRGILRGLQCNSQLGFLVESVFRESDLDRRAGFIDELYNGNKEIKWLTVATGKVLNAFLAAYDPVNNLTMISLKHRKALMDFLGAGRARDWDHLAVGQQIVQSNQLLRDETRALGVNGSARTQSCFWYCEAVEKLWKPTFTVTRPDKKRIAVSIPKDPRPEAAEQMDKAEVRESLQMQAALAEIGATMGHKIWLPRSDRQRVRSVWSPGTNDLLDQLPFKYDEISMRTIEQIDVLWIKNRSIVRAFEVEHTTSIYSGLLRMADLLATQPKLDIKLHIVAPSQRRAQVFSQISRPVFSLLHEKPLRQVCSYLSYDSVSRLREEKHLADMNDTVLRHYEEWAEEED